MGKYDDEIRECIFSFYRLDIKTLSGINKTLQHNYALIKEYYTRSISLSRYMKILHEFLEAYAQGVFLDACKTELHKVSREVGATRADVKNSIDIVGCCALTVLALLSSKPPYEIQENSYRLYCKKNDSYNDIWYICGVEGVCVDIDRKIVRIDSLVKNENRPRLHVSRVNTQV